MVALHEDFKPSSQYRLYFVITKICPTLAIWLGLFGFMLFFLVENVFFAAFFSTVGVLPLLWFVLYFQSVNYHFNKTEITWQIGICFKKTAIVPYDRITNVDIVQGPIMFLFHISNLEIQTTDSLLPVITLVGIKEPEPLCAFFMDLVRSQPSVVAVIGTESAGTSFYHTNSDMTALFEDFKPPLQYRSYLAIKTMGSIIFLWLFLMWTVVVRFGDDLSGVIFVGMVFSVIFLPFLVFTSLWVVLYYPSITYHLTKTEMIWKRGVWIKRTSIVPYNTITDVDIVQDPIMRLFHISDLKIQTAGSARASHWRPGQVKLENMFVGHLGISLLPEITLVGIKDPEPLRTFIMKLVRSQPSVAAAM